MAGGLHGFLAERGMPMSPPSITREPRAVLAACERERSFCGRRDEAIIRCFSVLPLNPSVQLRCERGGLGKLSECPHIS